MAYSDLPGERVRHNVFADASVPKTYFSALWSEAWSKYEDAQRELEWHSEKSPHWEPDETIPEEFWSWNAKNNILLQRRSDAAFMVGDACIACVESDHFSHQESADLYQKAQTPTHTIEQNTRICEAIARKTE